MYTSAETLNSAHGGRAQTPMETVDPPDEIVLGGDDDLGGGRGSGRSPVRHEIRDGDIAFVAHGRDDWNGRTRYRPRDDLFVEGPKILNRSPAPRHDDDVHAWHASQEPQT